MTAPRCIVPHIIVPHIIAPHIVAPAAFRSQPWKNGGGETAEIAR